MVYFRSQRIFCCQATKAEQKVIIRLSYQSRLTLLNTCMHWNTCTYPYKLSYSQRHTQWLSVHVEPRTHTHTERVKGIVMDISDRERDITSKASHGWALSFMIKPLRHWYKDIYLFQSFKWSRFLWGSCDFWIDNTSHSISAWKSSFLTPPLHSTHLH